MYARPVDPSRLACYGASMPDDTDRDHKPDNAPPAPDRGADDRSEPPPGWRRHEHVFEDGSVDTTTMVERPRAVVSLTSAWAECDSITAPAEARARGLEADVAALMEQGRRMAGEQLRLAAACDAAEARAKAAEERAAHHVGAARAAVEQAEARAREAERERDSARKGRDLAEVRIQERLDLQWQRGVDKGRGEGFKEASAAWRRRWARALGLPDAAGNAYRGLIDATKAARQAGREEGLREGLADAAERLHAMKRPPTTGLVTEAYQRMQRDLLHFLTRMLRGAAMAPHERDPLTLTALADAAPAPKSPPEPYVPDPGDQTMLDAHYAATEAAPMGGTPASKPLTCPECDSDDVDNVGDGEQAQCMACEHMWTPGVCSVCGPGCTCEDCPECVALGYESDVTEPPAAPMEPESEAEDIAQWVERMVLLFPWKDERAAKVRELAKRIRALATPAAAPQGAGLAVDVVPWVANWLRNGPAYAALQCADYDQPPGDDAPDIMHDEPEAVEALLGRLADLLDAGEWAPKPPATAAPSAPQAAPESSRVTVEHFGEAKRLRLLLHLGDVEHVMPPEDAQALRDDIDRHLPARAPHGWRLPTTSEERGAALRDAARHYSDTCEADPDDASGHLSNAWTTLVDAARALDGAPQGGPAGLSTPEPAPRRTDGRPVWDLVIDDMRQRDAEGRRKYGTPLQAFNGRRPLVDAYQEALDLVVYMRQAIEEAASPPQGERPEPASAAEEYWTPARLDQEAIKQGIVRPSEPAYVPKVGAVVMVEVLAQVVGEPNGSTVLVEVQRGAGRPAQVYVRVDRVRPTSDEPGEVET